MTRGPKYLPVFYNQGSNNECTAIFVREGKWQLARQSSERFKVDGQNCVSIVLTPENVGESYSSHYRSAEGQTEVIGVKLRGNNTLPGICNEIENRLGRHPRTIIAGHFFFDLREPKYRSKITKGDRPRLHRALKLSRALWDVDREKGNVNKMRTVLQPMISKIEFGDFKMKDFVLETHDFLEETRDTVTGTIDLDEIPDAASYVLPDSENPSDHVPISFFSNDLKLKVTCWNIRGNMVQQPISHGSKSSSSAHQDVSGNVLQRKPGRGIVQDATQNLLLTELQKCASDFLFGDKSHKLLKDLNIGKGNDSVKLEKQATDFLADLETAQSPEVKELSIDPEQRKGLMVFLASKLEKSNVLLDNDTDLPWNDETSQEDKIPSQKDKIRLLKLYSKLDQNEADHKELRELQELCASILKKNKSTSSIASSTSDPEEALERLEEWFSVQGERLVDSWLKNPKKRLNFWLSQPVRNFILDDGSGGNKEHEQWKDYCDENIILDDVAWEHTINEAALRYGYTGARAKRVKWLEADHAAFGDPPPVKEDGSIQYDYLKLMVWDLLLLAIQQESKHNWNKREENSATQWKETYKQLQISLSATSNALEAHIRKVCKLLATADVISDVIVLCDVPAAALRKIGKAEENDKEKEVQPQEMIVEELEKACGVSYRLLYGCNTQTREHRKFGRTIILVKEGSVASCRPLPFVSTEGSTQCMGALLRTWDGKEVEIIGIKLPRNFERVCDEIEDRLLRREVCIVAGDFGSDLRKNQYDQKLSASRNRLGRLLRASKTMWDIPPTKGSRKEEFSAFQSQLTKIDHQDFSMRDFILLGAHTDRSAWNLGGLIDADEILPNANNPSDSAPITWRSGKWTNLQGRALQITTWNVRCNVSAQTNERQDEAESSFLELRPGEGTVKHPKEVKLLDDLIAKVDEVICPGKSDPPKLGEFLENEGLCPIKHLRRAEESAGPEAWPLMFKNRSRAIQNSMLKEQSKTWEKKFGSLHKDNPEPDNKNTRDDQKANLKKFFRKIGQCDDNDDADLVALITYQDV